MKRRRYHSYLLLELLVAITLIALCVVPFVGIPGWALRREIAAMQRAELHRLSDLAFCEVKEKLCRQEIKWEDLCSESDKKMRLFQDTVILSADKEFGKKKVARRCELYSTGKVGANNEEYRLVTIIISFGPKKKKLLKYEYKLLVSKRAGTIDTGVRRG